MPRLRGFLLLAALAACSSQRDEELAAVKGAHSTVAEWAAVAKLFAAGRVGPVYAGEMRDHAREALASDRARLKGRAAAAVDALGAEPSPAALARAARALDAAEKTLEAR